MRIAAVVMTMALVAGCGSAAGGGDGSVIPASLSVNPSLTIMALAAMIAENIGSEL